MPGVVSYSSTGTKSSAKVSLDKNVFGIDVKNHQLLKEAYEAYLANGRLNLAKVKTRGEVSGSTKKPWKQKGTGRARFGSKYNPIWRGGGVAFGPTGNENYSKKISVTNKRLALRQALSLACASDKIKMIDSFESKDGKVAGSLKMLEKVESKGRTLLVVDEKNEMTNRATRNIANLNTVQANYLNVFDLLNADTILITKKSVDIVCSWLTSPSKSPAVKGSEK